MYSNVTSFEDKFLSLLASQYGITNQSCTKSHQYKQIIQALFHLQSLSYSVNNPDQLIGTICILQGQYLTDSQTSILFNLQQNIFTSLSYIYTDSIVLVLGTYQNNIFNIIGIAPPVYDTKFIHKVQYVNPKIAIPSQAKPYFLILKTVTSYLAFSRFKALLQQLPVSPSHIFVFNWSFASHGDFTLPPNVARALTSANLLQEVVRIHHPNTRLVLGPIGDVCVTDTRVFPQVPNDELQALFPCDIIQDPTVFSYGKSRILIHGVQITQQVRCSAQNERLESTVKLGAYEQVDQVSEFPANQTVHPEDRNIIAESLLQTIIVQQNCTPAPSSSFLKLTDSMCNFHFDTLILIQEDLQQYNCQIHGKRCAVVPDFGKGAYCTVAGCHGVSSIAFYE
ncbi:hypothetical protein SS50377_23272 [Spironucleus salmonicida]|nr:hypothetical protein SS50377_23272 [Spironucleus salmonicida]